MIIDPEMNRDIQDIMLIGTDAALYANLAMFLNGLDKNDESHVRKFREGVHNLANLIRYLEKA